MVLCRVLVEERLLRCMRPRQEKYSFGRWISSTESEESVSCPSIGKIRRFLIKFTPDVARTVGLQPYTADDHWPPHRMLSSVSRTVPNACMRHVKRHRRGKAVFLRDQQEHRQWCGIYLQRHTSEAIIRRPRIEHREEGLNGKPDAGAVRATAETEYFISPGSEFYPL